MHERCIKYQVQAPPRARRAYGALPSCDCLRWCLLSFELRALDPEHGRHAFFPDSQTHLQHHRDKVSRGGPEERSPSISRHFETLAPACQMPKGGKGKAPTLGIRFWMPVLFPCLGEVWGFAIGESQARVHKMNSSFRLETSHKYLLTGPHIPGIFVHWIGARDLSRSERKEAAM